MERRRLGRTDMHVSALGFGGSEIGYEGVGQSVATRLLNAALDAGLNVIDTAECYVDSETLIGRAVGGRRGEFHLFPPVGQAGGWGREDWRPPAILKSIERSLARLRTDAVDLVQLHSCAEGVLRRGDAITALEMARQRATPSRPDASIRCRSRSASPTRPPSIRSCRQRASAASA